MDHVATATLEIDMGEIPYRGIGLRDILSHGADAYIEMLSRLLRRSPFIGDKVIDQLFILHRDIASFRYVKYYGYPKLHSIS